MKRIEIDELKKISSDMLREVDKICRKNNITYYLSFGSLIGAVRHKGFIPWDDDIDICVFRKDYNRLMEAIQKDERYRFISFETDPNYYFGFGRICDKRTIIKHRLHRKVKNFGVWIDVFILDNAPEESKREEWAQQFKRLNKILRATVPTPFEFYSIRYWLSKKFFIYYLKSYKTRLRFGTKNFSKYRDKFIQLQTKYDESSNYVMVPITPYGAKVCFPKTWFEDTIDLDFEGIKVMAPKDYDKILTKTYGNYMQIPPIEKRIKRHYFQAYWLNKK